MVYFIFMYFRFETGKQNFLKKLSSYNTNDELFTQTGSKIAQMQIAE